MAFFPSGHHHFLVIIGYHGEGWKVINISHMRKCGPTGLEISKKRDSFLVLAAPLKEDRAKGKQ